MKKLICVLVIIAVLLGLSYWIDGIMFKRQYFNLITVINNDNHLKVTVINYEQGWLTSQAKLRIEPVSVNSNNPVLMNALKEMYLVIDQTITHGPIIFASDSPSFFGTAFIKNEIHVPDQLESQLLKDQTDYGVMTISTLVKYDNTWMNHIETPEFKRWHGLNADIAFHLEDNIINEVNSTMTIGALSVTSTPINPNIVELSTQPITLTNTAVRQSMGLWNSNSTAIIPNLTIKDKSGSSLMVDGVDETLAFGVTNNTMFNAGLSLAIKNIMTSSLAFKGMSNVGVKVEIKNLSALGVVTLKDFVAHTPLNTTQALQEYNNLQVKLITNQSAFGFTLAAATTYGKVTFNSNFVWPSTVALPVTRDDIALKTNLNVNLRIPIELVNQVIDNYLGNTIVTNPIGPAITNPTTQQPITRADLFRKNIAAEIRRGSIKQVGTDYVVSITRVNGVMKINGNAFNAQGGK